MVSVIRSNEPECLVRQVVEHVRHQLVGRKDYIRDVRNCDYSNALFRPIRGEKVGVLFAIHVSVYETDQERVIPFDP